MGGFPLSDNPVLQYQVRSGSLDRGVISQVPSDTDSAWLDRRNFPMDPHYRAMANMI
jgi:hypothetical protein